MYLHRYSHIHTAIREHMELYIPRQCINPPETKFFLVVKSQSQLLPHHYNLQSDKKKKQKKNYNVLMPAYKFSLFANHSGLSSWVLWQLQMFLFLSHIQGRYKLVPVV